MDKKIDLHVSIVPDVFYCCCVLHNLTIRKGFLNIEEVMQRIVNDAEEEVCHEPSFSVTIHSSTFSTGLRCTIRIS